MNDPALPQCLSAARFHEMVMDGSLPPEALDAVASDSRMGDQYAALRSCDGAFRSMMLLAQQQPRHRRQQQQQQQQQEEAKRAAQDDPRALYSQYLHCVGSAMCDPALRGWYACLQRARDKKTALADCATDKRLLERCLRATTEDLLRASQPDVFP